MKMIILKRFFLVPIIVLAIVDCSIDSAYSQSHTKVSTWITTADRTQLLSPSITHFKKGLPSGTIIEIDETTTYQTIDGFGYSLTGGSAMLIKQKLNSEQQSTLLKELFQTTEGGIGISYLRISIGASDLDDHVFSYDDLPATETDPSLSKFSLGSDRSYLIPILKQALTLNAHLRIMGTPRSPPVWMKTNSHAKGGSLKPEYYDAYALYFVRYIQEMRKEGIPIDAITIQNEPENPNNTPSMLMTAAEQNDFIKNHLGPAFQLASIKTKIILFDHNCDHPEYPLSILNDKETKAMVDGTAFHLYLGDIRALATVHVLHPDKNIYFTEQWTSGKGDFGDDLCWHIKNVILGATRNWSRIALEWNLAADENYNPHTPEGGCDSCLGALTIGSDVRRNVSYYIIAHASKFVIPGSLRIRSTVVDQLPNVAFLTPDGKKVVIVLNDSHVSQVFSFRYKNRIAINTLPAGAVGTFEWR